MRAVLVRFLDNGAQTLGKLYLFDGFDLVFSCFTLEPAWKDNAVGLSCIPPGRYRLVPRAASESAKLSYDHLAVTGVPDRTAILVHRGNYRDATEGCVLVGDRVADLNGDGEDDIANSKATLKRLLAALEGPAVFDVVESAAK